MTDNKRLIKLAENSHIGEETGEIFFRIFKELPKEIRSFATNNISIAESRIDKKRSSENNYVSASIDIKNSPTRYIIILDSIYYNADANLKAYIIIHQIGYNYYYHRNKKASEEKCVEAANKLADKYGSLVPAEESIKDIFTLHFWTIRRIVLITLIILAFFMVDFAEKFEHLLQWVVFIV
jgi:hypothetical protein